MKNAILPERIQSKIFQIRGWKVMLDYDLAVLYGVATFNLNKAVKRNLDRFPKDFMFQLNLAETQNLIFQIGISSPKWGGRRHRSYAFTEQGVAMLSSVLHSKRAVQVNIEIMRAFVRLRAMLSQNQALARRFDRLKKDCKAEFENVWDAIEDLPEPPVEPKPQIGFKLRTSPPATH